MTGSQSPASKPWPWAHRGSSYVLAYGVAEDVAKTKIIAVYREPKVIDLEGP